MLTSSSLFSDVASRAPLSTPHPTVPHHEYPCPHSWGCPEPPRQACWGGNPRVCSEHSPHPRPCPYTSCQGAGPPLHPPASPGDPVLRSGAVCDAPCLQMHCGPWEGTMPLASSSERKAPSSEALHLLFPPSGHLSCPLCTSQHLAQVSLTRSPYQVSLSSELQGALVGHKPAGAAPPTPRTLRPGTGKRWGQGLTSVTAGGLRSSPGPLTELCTQWAPNNYTLGN